ncbi:MAG TPA: hypothetical protein ENK44_01940 [Caldithrix abyssi]|uniref:TNase-like domain-containing protein n=1 Tax=Caldithrix abyssi TaxID=187145 RepID=A0A7V4TXT5_CALAY|nr:hypothetical protein [Caldithrix abyssi]
MRVSLPAQNGIKPGKKYSPTKAFLIIVFFCFFSTGLTAEEVRITEVKDAGLFVTDTGQCLRLAGLTCVSMYSADERERHLALLVMEYAQKNLLDIPLEGDFAGKDSSGCLLVHLYRPYPLEKFNINAFYLQKGYARYSRVNNAGLDSLYRKASTEAKREGQGLWNLNQYLPTTISPYRRFRVLGGGLGDINLDHFLINIWFNYRWSDLLPVVKNEDMLLSVSAETGLAVYLLFPYAGVGLEARYRNLSVRASTGWVVSIYYHKDEAFKAYSFFRLGLGAQVQLSEKGYLGPELWLIWLREASEPMLSIGMAVPIF